MAGLDLLERGLPPSLPPVRAWWGWEEGDRSLERLCTPPPLPPPLPLPAPAPAEESGWAVTRAQIGEAIPGHDLEEREELEREGKEAAILSLSEERRRTGWWSTGQTKPDKQEKEKL
uniref:Uncharacterized protein n=1 Tax=Oryza rufipogon TaxID=4529 RepID=A0A0E0QDH3_ORYRU